MELCEFTEGKAKIEVPKFEKTTEKTPVFTILRWLFQDYHVII